MVGLRELIEILKLEHIYGKKKNKPSLFNFVGFYGTDNYSE